MQISMEKIKQCMRRAAAGGELTLGFFGGSITQGSLATQEAYTYARRVFAWWEENFPQAEFHYVNGGIGGTTSHFGVSRVQEHLLMYAPDFVVVDFSVNDEAQEGAFFQETYEGLLRRILSAPSQPAVLVLNNVFYDTGVNAQDYHNAVAGYYGVPHVSIRDTVYKEICDGVYKKEDLTSDNLHPNDEGHRLVAQEIIKLLARCKQDLENGRQGENPCGQRPEYALLPPLTANAYEHALRLTIANSSPKLSGFRVDAREKCGCLDHFKNGWIGKAVGDKICFEVTASCIAVQYRKTIRKPSPVAKVTLDGNAQQAQVLDGNFDEDWGDCLYLQPILHHGMYQAHRVEIEITEAQEPVAMPFYLMSLIIA